MKIKNYLFIFFLVIILVFIVAFRYGQQVEKTKQAIDYIQQFPTPTTIISPTPVGQTEYKSKKWGLKIKYPSNLTIKESTNTPEILLEIDKTATK